MAKFITRTIVTTEIQVAEVKVENGEFLTSPLQPIVLDGKVAEDKVLKVAQKQYKGLQVVVADVKHVERKFKVSYEDFMHIAEEVSLEDEVEEVEDMEVMSDTDALIEKHQEAL